MGDKSDIQNVIYSELIFLNKDFKSRDEVFDFLAKKVYEIELVNNKDDFIYALEQRESIMPTNVGNLIGIPHGKTNAVENPFIAFMRLNDEIDWIEDESDKVKLVFMIGVPEDKASKVHLKIISELSKKLIDDDFNKMLLNETDKDVIYRNLNSIKIKEEK